MQKKFEDYNNGRYCKGYETDLNPVEFVSSLEKKGFLMKIEMSEDADVGLKSFGGEFAPETFYTLYDAIKGDLDTVAISFSNVDAYLVMKNENNWFMYTSNKDLELTDMLEISKSK